MDKDEKPFASGEEEVHVLLYHSFELSRSIFEHDFESAKAKNELLSNK